MTLLLFKRCLDPKMGRYLLPVLLALVWTACLQAQAVRAGGSCRLLGTDTVTAGSTASFTLDSCMADSWSVSCGTVTAQAPGILTVNFAVTSCGSTVITASQGGAALASRTVTVQAAPPLVAGMMTDLPQTIRYNRTCRVLSAPLSSGGVCGGLYAYQWLSSSDSINFSPVAGATSQNFQPGSLTSTTYFKRQTSCGGSVVSGNAVKITVYPPFSGLSLTPAAQSVSDSAAPGSLGLTARMQAGLTGQWQRSAASGFAGAAPAGGAGPSFMDGPLRSTTYYRLLLMAAGDSFYSSPAVVYVFPPLQAGAVSPSSQATAYDSLPALLSCTGVSGGNGVYTYQWYRSADSSSGWSPLAGVMTADFDPGPLQSTVYFRVLVSSGGRSAASIPAVVRVAPSLAAATSSGTSAPGEADKNTAFRGQ